MKTPCNLNPAAIGRVGQASSLSARTLSPQLADQNLPRRHWDRCGQGADPDRLEACPTFLATSWPSVRGFTAAWLLRVAAAMVLFTATAPAQWPPPPPSNPPPGANYSQAGFAGSGYAINPGGSGSVNVYTGNLHREVKDLEVWGGVGEHQLVFTRYYNSRTGGTTKHFGKATWRHSYQWEMADNGADLDVFYPDGTRNKFTDVGGSKWTSTAAVPDVMWVNLLRVPSG